MCVISQCCTRPRARTIRVEGQSSIIFLTISSMDLTPANGLCIKGRQLGFHGLRLAFCCLFGHRNSLSPSAAHPERPCRIKRTSTTQKVRHAHPRSGEFLRNRAEPGTSLGSPADVLAVVHWRGDDCRSGGGRGSGPRADVARATGERHSEPEHRVVKFPVARWAGDPPAQPPGLAGQPRRPARRGQVAGEPGSPTPRAGTVGGGTHRLQQQIRSDIKRVIQPVK